MKKLIKYTISIAQLETKSYNFEMDGSSEFFNYFEMESVQNGQFLAKIELAKSETMISLTFGITGSLVLVCDRSLEHFEYPIVIHDSLILKFADHDEDLADGIRLINRSTQLLDLSHEIYELLSLSIPMKKLHPRFLTEENDTESEGFIVYSTAQNEQALVEKESIVDPRWLALKNLN